MTNLTKAQRQAVLSLSKQLLLPPQVIKAVDEVLSSKLLSCFEGAENKLIDAASAALFYKRLEDGLCAESPDGMAILTVYLKAACLTKEAYSQNSIPKEIFIDTMRCFSRFLQEAMLREGKYVFNRAFWAWRHLSCTIFRLGTLEFEYRTILSDEAVPPKLKAGAPVLSVHIPSDAALTDIELENSYNQANSFFKSHAQFLCPHGLPQAIICGSWLLSVPLRECLKPSSGILKFAQDYEIYHANDDDDSFYQWLFNNKKPPVQLPQATSLQRAVALHVQQGGKVGVYYGIKKC